MKIIKIIGLSYLLLHGLIIEANQGKSKFKYYEAYPCEDSRKKDSFLVASRIRQWNLHETRDLFDGSNSVKRRSTYITVNPASEGFSNSSVSYYKKLVDDAFATTGRPRIQPFRITDPYFNDGYNLFYKQKKPSVRFIDDSSVIVIEEEFEALPLEK